MEALTDELASLAFLQKKVVFALLEVVDLTRWVEALALRAEVGSSCAVMRRRVVDVGKAASASVRLRRFLGCHSEAILDHLQGSALCLDWQLK